MEAKVTGNEDRARAPRILAVAPYANPHVTSIYDALAGHADLDVRRASLHALPPERIGLGWPEMSPAAPYLQPWRRLGDRWALRRELARADVAILPGPFHLKRLPLDFAWRLAFSRGPILAWSEPFLRFRERSPANMAALSTVARLLDSPRIQLLSIGSDAIADYRAIGVRRWSARSFAFAVEPSESLPRPREPRQGLPDGAPLRLLFAGELIERKRVDLLLDALAASQVPRTGWSLEIIGAGPERASLEALSARLGLADRVKFLGVFYRGGLLAHLRGVDAVILPSRFDGWGAIVNEALEARVAAVVSDACGAASMLTQGSSGLIFRSGDARDLADNLARLMADRDLARRLGEAGHAAVREHRPEAIAARLASLCRGLGGQGGVPGFDEGESGILREMP